MNNFSNSNTGKFEYTEYAKNFMVRAFQHAMQANLPFYWYCYVEQLVWTKFVKWLVKLGNLYKGNLWNDRHD